MDGALGTMVMENGLMENSANTDCYPELLSLTDPGKIIDIHRQYLQSGSRIITTNTFNANPISLRRILNDGKEELVKNLNIAATRLASESIKDFNGISIAGSVGPTDHTVSKYPEIPGISHISSEELYNAFHLQIDSLIEGGVDLLLFETFYDLNNLRIALQAATNVISSRNTSVPVMISATINPHSRQTLFSQSLEELVEIANEHANVRSIGLNCVNPQEILPAIRELRQLTTLPLSAHPNAGEPDSSGHYNISSQQFGELLNPFISENLVSVIGGCCGTTPGHIAELSKLIKTLDL